MMSKQSHSWLAPLRRVAQWRAMFLLAAAMFVAACDSGRGLQITAESDEPHYRRGRQMVLSGQNPEALEAFLKVIDKRRGDAPESHLEAAQIYINHIKDPIAAIYHYRKYLELKPNSPQAQQVWQLIDTAKKEFARTLAAEPLGPQVERLDLLDALEKLKAENATLRAAIAQSGRTAPPPTTLAQVENRPPTSNPGPRETALADVSQIQPVVPIEPEPAPQRAQPQRPAGQTSQQQTTATTTAGARTYVVQQKDTLYKISTRYYGTGSRWTSILDANRDQLGSANDLKPGMVLRIP